MPVSRERVRLVALPDVRNGRAAAVGHRRRAHRRASFAPCVLAVLLCAPLLLAAQAPAPRPGDPPEDRPGPAAAGRRLPQLPGAAAAFETAGVQVAHTAYGAHTGYGAERGTADGAEADAVPDDDFGDTPDPAGPEGPGDFEDSGGPENSENDGDFGADGDFENSGDFGADGGFRGFGEDGADAAGAESAEPVAPAPSRVAAGVLREYAHVRAVRTAPPQRERGRERAYEHRARPQPPARARKFTPAPVGRQRAVPAGSRTRTTVPDSADRQPARTPATGRADTTDTTGTADTARGGADGGTVRTAPGGAGAPDRAEASRSGGTEALPPVPKPVRPLLPYGAGLASIGLGLALFALRLRR